MRVLHYTVGLPPERNGGSIQYANDLMREQARQGHKVFALTCGDTLIRGNKASIKNARIRDGIKVFKLTNPLTPTLIYGSSDPNSQHRKIAIDCDSIRDFIENNQIEAMHLHTLMGIHKDVVEYIKSLGVKIIYTSHDFHGICPHCNLINSDGDICDAANGHNCAICNINEPSDRFLRLANSSFYHFLKGLSLFSIISKPKVYKSNHIEIENNVVTITKERENEYAKLLDYYREYFGLIDKFHFNSTQTKGVFQSFLPGIDGKVINVITKGISDNREPISPDNIIKFGFIGSLNGYKGFPMLKEVAQELYNEGIRNFKISAYPGTFTGTDPDLSLIEYCPPYKYSDISKVLYGMDCLIVPSKWYETFSLVTLEALGHGRPVIVSDHVGAKDIVSKYNSNFIFSSKDELKSLLRKTLSNSENLIGFSQKIMNMPLIYSIKHHTKEIIKYYNE